MNTTTFLTSRLLFHVGKPTSFPHPKLHLNRPSTRHSPTRCTFSSAAGTLALAAALLVKPPLALATAPQTVERLESTTNTTTNPDLSHAPQAVERLESTTNTTTNPDLSHAPQAVERFESTAKTTTNSDLSHGPQTVERLESTTKTTPKSDLSHLLDSNPETINAIRSLVYRKLELGEDPEALRLIEQLVIALPEDLQWRFLLGRLLIELGRLDDALKVFEEILQKEPLSFEALFESAVLMDRCGYGEAAMERLRSTLEAATGEGKKKEAREVKLIMAQMQYLQSNIEEALESYEELSKEDPKDHRPYFCQGVIYTLLDRNGEAREKFDIYKELSPRKFDVDGYLQTPLSHLKLFGSSNDD